MALHAYKKKPVGGRKKILTVISYSTMTIGALFLFWSFYPIVASEIYGHIFINNDIVAPVPGSVEATSIDKAKGVKGTSNAYTTNLVDYTKASSWFFDAPEQSIHKYSNDITEYTLDVPKLDIYGAKVIVGGDDLLSGLIQYAPDPDRPPGTHGTANIFGHSTHSSLYKPDDLKSIFTFLHTLENGDVIHITIDKVRYTYEIFDKIIIDPSEVSALNAKYDDSYVNLFTCYPPGTYSKRLQLKSRLKSSPIL